MFDRIRGQDGDQTLDLDDLAVALWEAAPEAWKKKLCELNGVQWPVAVATAASPGAAQPSGGKGGLLAVYRQTREMQKKLLARVKGQDAAIAEITGQRA